MNWTDRRQKFRAILAGGRCIHPGSVFDPTSARIAEDVGFELAMFAGSIASMTVLGAPDLIVLTLSEFADQALRINRAAGLPLMVDADHGYGNALNVKRTVEELQHAGVAAMTIEDTELPQPYGALGQTRLIPVEEGVGKMRAALKGRTDPDLVIAARTSAMSVNGVEDTILRAKAYEAVGVDAVFLSGVTRGDQLSAVAVEINIPILLGGSGPGIGDLDFLAANGVRVCLQGHQPFMAAIHAVHATLKALRDGTSPKELENIASPELMKQVTRDADYRRWMKEFLGGE